MGERIYKIDRNFLRTPAVYATALTADALILLARYKLLDNQSAEGTAVGVCFAGFAALAGIRSYRELHHNANAFIEHGMPSELPMAEDLESIGKKSLDDHEIKDLSFDEVVKLFRVSRAYRETREMNLSYALADGGMRTIKRITTDVDDTLEITAELPDRKVSVQWKGPRDTAVENQSEMFTTCKLQSMDLRGGSLVNAYLIIDPFGSYEIGFDRFSYSLFERDQRKYDVTERENWISKKILSQRALFEAIAFSQDRTEGAELHQIKPDQAQLSLKQEQSKLFPESI